jgi:hypothetical protein
MSDAASSEKRPQGTDLLPRRLTEAVLDSAPALASLDVLVIEDLDDEEYDRFLEALGVE